MIGGGVTHAWAHIYLPGAGWVPFDPTNGLVSDRNLIRVAVTRDPSQAVPLKGSFIGKPGDFLGWTLRSRSALSARCLAAGFNPSATDFD